MAGRWQVRPGRTFRRRAVFPQRTRETGRITANAVPASRVCITVQEAKVCLVSRFRYRLTSQKPEALTKRFASETVP